MRILIELDLKAKLTAEELDEIKARAAESGVDPGEAAARLIRAGLKPDGDTSRRPRRKCRPAA